MTNEHFIVWMRASGLPTFRKLWGKVPEGLSRGNYVLEVDDQYEVTSFNGKKSIVISTMSSLGGKNQLLAVSYILCGIICLCIAVGFILFEAKERKQIREDRKKREEIQIAIANM